MTHLWGITDLYPVCNSSSVVGWMLSSHQNHFHRKLSLFMLCLCWNLQFLLHIPFYCID